MEIAVARTCDGVLSPGDELEEGPVLVVERIEATMAATLPLAAFVWRPCGWWRPGCGAWR